ncbi:MAG: 2-oxo-4-hydroxy-4-carboxy-5-ureidoimidazoline decarboxylase [Bacteroidota bacterium]|nr:2-oxo-4-hydroxy-4-carboxy-5-ureidoimidazoline decarboxylase [Bacteroidota bacterium]
MTIAEFDHLETEKKKELLQKCCGSSAWVNKMLNAPVANDLIDLLEDAEDKWNECTPEEKQEAFQHHPMIGDVQSIKEKFASTAAWANEEQKGVSEISEDLAKEFAYANKKYHEKFGYIFIVFATGKSAKEMLDILQKRFNNTAEDEIKIAADEQLRITQNRLEKLFK